MATQFAVDLVFKSQTKSLNDIQRKLQQLEANLNKIKGGKPFKPIEDGAGRAGVKVNGLVKTLGKLALAYGALRAGQAAISAGISRIESERRIQFLAQSYGEAAQLAQAAANAARKFGVSQTEANEALATTYARLRPVGVSLQEIEGIYAGFSTAARISGASATEAEGAFRQLAQGLGSGALRGDEFNSVAEQVPLILTAVSKETGIAQGKLRDYAAEGKITSDVVIRALKRIEKEGADQLEAALDGPQQKIKDFQNASEDLAVAFSRELIPEMTGAISELAQTLRDLIPILKAIGRVAAAVFKYIGGLARRINDMMNGARMAQAELAADAQAQKQTREKYGILGALTKEAQEYRAAVKQAQLLAAKDALNPIPELSAAAAPDFGGGPSFSGGGGGGGGGSSSKEGEKLARELQRSLAAGTQLSREFSRQVQLLKAEGEIEKSLLQVQFDKQDRELQIAELKSQEQQATAKLLSDELARLQTLEAMAPLVKQMNEERLQGASYGDGKVVEQLNPNGKIGDYLKQTNDWINDTEGRVVELAGSMESNLAGAFQSILDGSKSTQEAFSDMFKGIAASFLQMATQMIAKMIIMSILNKALGGILGGGGTSVAGAEFGSFSGGSFGIDTSGLAGPLTPFAEGGIVRKPTAALIGEAGPEAVIPLSEMSKMNSSGEVNSVVNVTINSDGSSNTDASQGEQLGRQINSAVKAIIMHERRPGGLLAR